jgi:hypothetical protein
MILLQSKGKLIWEASQPANASKPSLLDLPSDILYMIYQEVFASPKIIKNIRKRLKQFHATNYIFKGGGLEFHVPEHGQLVDTAIMTTCRQIYCESSKVFYNENIFFVDHNHSVRVQAHGTVLVSRPLICRDYTKFIREVVFPLQRAEWWNAMIEPGRTIATWPALITLHINVYLEAYRNLEFSRQLKGRDESTRLVFECFRNICGMHNIKIPRHLSVKLRPVRDTRNLLFDERSLQELQTILDEALVRFRKLRRL